MSIKIMMTSITALALVCSTPAVAGTSDDDEKELLIGALLGNALGGKTTLGDKAGEVEGWIVVAPLLSSAAMKIGIETAGNGGILLVGAESPDLGLGHQVEMQRRLFATVFAQTCTVPKRNDDKFGGLLNLPSANELADIIKAAPAPSTEFRGYTLAPGDQALIAAIQSRTTNWRRLDDVMTADSRLQQRWEELRADRDRYSAGTCAKTEGGKANVERFDALDAKLSALGENGEPSLLDRAFRIDALLESGLKPTVLRVKVEQAGGSIVNTDNLWTRLGYPAIGITGALVVSYRMVDVATGSSVRAGLIVCRAPKTTMGALHRKTLPPSDPARCTAYSNGSAQ